MENKSEKTKWKMNVCYIDSCNCDWGCPCQFMSRPTHGNCDGFGTFFIKKGNYGSTSLDNLSAALILSYPGAVHEGNGRASYYVDEKATSEQFDALCKILIGEAGGGPFEIYASTCSDIQPPRKAKINFQESGTTSRVEIESVGEVQLEPIRNPVTNEEHRAIIELPGGFEASRMEQASSKKLLVDDSHLNFRYAGTYGSVSEANWSGP